MNKTEITFKNHGVTFEGITLLDAEEVQVAIQTIHSNFEAEIAALGEGLETLSFSEYETIVDINNHNYARYEALIEGNYIRAIKEKD